MSNPWTPGPWEWVQNRFWGGYSGIVGPDNQEVLYPNTANDGDTGAAWFEDFPIDADRRLIAAAPEMAEVMADFDRALECGCRPCRGDCTSDAAKAIAFDAMRDEARALLARIRGDAP